MLQLSALLLFNAAATAGPSRGRKPLGNARHHRQIGHAVADTAASEDQAHEQDARNDERAADHPGRRHRRRHRQPSLPQVSPQVEKTADQQQPQRRRDICGQQQKGKASGCLIIGREKKLAEPKQRQCRQREIEHPHARSMRPTPSVYKSLPEALARKLDCRHAVQAGRCLAAAACGIQPGCLEQARSGICVFVVLVDHGAVPGEAVGRPPDEGHQADAQQRAECRQRTAKLDKPPGRDGHEDRQRRCKQRRLLTAVFDRDAGNPHRPHHKPGHDELQTSAKLPLVEDLDQKEDHAADEQPDQDGSHSDRQVVAQRWLESLSCASGHRLLTFSTAQQTPLRQPLAARAARRHSQRSPRL